MKKGTIILCLMACVGMGSVQAQTIELPTKKKAVKQETVVPQQNPQNGQPTAPVVKEGGTVVLPTTRHGTTSPIVEQVPSNDTTSTVITGLSPLPVVHRQLAPRAKPIVRKPKVEDNTIYESAEQMPTYPGGAPELMKFISERLVYPQEALADSIQGIVQVSFIVEKDGSTTEFEVLDEHHPALEAEAVRILQQMPKWTPASQRGVKVRVEYVVPVKFTIPNN